MEAIIDDFCQWVYFSPSGGIDACLSKKKNTLTVQAAHKLVALGPMFQDSSSILPFQASILSGQIHQATLEKSMNPQWIGMLHFEFMKDDGGIEHLFESSSSSLKTTNTLLEYIQLVGESAENMGLDINWIRAPFDGITMNFTLPPSGQTIGEFYRQMLLLRALSEILANARGIRVASASVSFGEVKFDLNVHLAENVLSHV